MNVHDLLSLKGKTALITGGSRGLGLQMAEALGEMGAKVAITRARRTSSTKPSLISILSRLPPFHLCATSANASRSRHWRTRC